MLEIMKSGKWDIDKMITDQYLLENLPEAIERAVDVDNALNVIIRFD